MPVTPEEALRQLALWRQQRNAQIGQAQAARAAQNARRAEIDRRLADYRRQQAVGWNRMPLRANYLNELNVPEDAINTITLEPIVPENVIVNFSGPNASKRESSFGRYYKETSIKRLNKNPEGHPIHPMTREPMFNITRYRPRFPTSAAAGPAARSRRAATRKSRRKNRKSRRNNRK